MYGVQLFKLRFYMSEQDNGKVSTLPRPTADNREDWVAYWKQQGQSWRSEPEIDLKRQGYLHKLLSVKQGTGEEMYPSTPLKGVDLTRADIEWLLAASVSQSELVDLRNANLRDLDLRGLPLKGVDLRSAHLEKSDLRGIDLDGSDLFKIHLEGADLRGGHLEQANLGWAHLEGTFLRGTHLEGSKLGGAFFADKTNMRGVILSNKQYGFASLAGVHWGDVDLSVVDWTQLKFLGDECRARQSKMSNGEAKDDRTRLEEYQAAVRANRQLAIVLRSQGLNEEGARFAYRAQLMQRKAFWYQRKFGQYFFSLFLDLLSGYGYKPIRSFIAYLIVIAAFATAYFIIGQTAGPHLSPLESVVFSMTSFHGRGFFPGGIGLDDPLTVLAALEAFVGLLIEVTFIATLTQRLFGK
jgi:uncharacterized protein YjbI with pentapeptide repeats